MVKLVRAKLPRKKTALVKRKPRKLVKKHQSSSDEEFSGDDYGPLSDKLTTDIRLSDDDEAGSHSDINSEDSDYEIQVALREGLLQSNGLNIECEAPRQKINKRKEMADKFEQFHKKRKFIETLAVDFASELSYGGAVSSDFEREAAFMKQAQHAVLAALPQLQTLKLPVFRPDDYFAEMAKSDQHMQKVRHHILDIQKDNEQRESARRLREEKRFALKVQGAAEDRKRREKRKLLEAVKKHRKGMKGQLEQMLNSNAVHNLDNDDDVGPRKKGGKFANRGSGQKFGGKRGKMSRSSRDEKFGFGGKKKRSKQNDQDSFFDGAGDSGGGRRKSKFGGGGSGQKFGGGRKSNQKFCGKEKGSRSR